MTGADAFTGPAVEGYEARPPRQVPGFHDLHRMTALLLAEAAPAAARILVLGAGGGLELAALSAAQPGWRFDGVDPSADMLALAARVAGPHMDRIALHHGRIGAAPPGPFDGAVSLLTFHFIPRAERAGTLAALHRRLRPGAALVLAHLSVPEEDAARDRWLDRHIAFGAREGAPPPGARSAMRERLHLLAPEEEEAMLAAAGFAGAELFYAGFAVRGWVARRA